jgi:sugar phosphate isomerase/epimerase
VVTLSFPTVNCLQMPLAGRPPVPSVLRPLDEVLAGVAAAGFSHVGIDNFSVQDHVERGADLTGVGQLLERLGLSCSDVGVLRIGEPAPTAEAARAMAALAGSTGASICTTAMEVEPGAAAVQTLRRCADVLAPQGVRMALEFLPYSPLSTLRSARELCATVGWDLCGVLIDSWMFFRGDNSFADLEDMTAKEIGYVQFDDAPEPVGDDPAYESRHRRLPPGTGTFDLYRFAGAVLDTGFDGVVSVEVLSDELRALAPVEQGRRAIAAARSFWPVADSTGAEVIPA